MSEPAKPTTTPAPTAHWATDFANAVVSGYQTYYSLSAVVQKGLGNTPGTTNITAAAANTPADLEAAKSQFISSVLTNSTSTKEAEDLTKIPGVTFKQADGSYAKTITQDSIKQVGVELNGETRYFKQIHQADSAKSPSGLRATAWVETNAAGNAIDNNGTENGGQNLWLTYPGFNGKAGDGSPQANSLDAVGKAQLNPQTAEIPAFVAASLNAIGTNNVGAVNVGAHSLGSSNALASQLTLDVQGISSQTILLEPAGASLAKEKITEAVKDSNSAFAKELAKVANSNVAISDATAKLGSDDRTISIRAINTSADGKISLSNTAMLDPDSGALAKMSNTSTMLMGRAGNSPDKVAPDNEMVGQRSFITARNASNNISSSPSASFDPAHALANISAELQRKASGTPAAAGAQGAPTTAPAEQQLTPVQKIIKDYPEFGKLVLAAIEKGGGPSDSQLIKRLQDDMVNNPDKIKKFADAIEPVLKATPELAEELAATFSPSQVSNPKIEEYIGAIYDNPEIISKLGKKLEENPDMLALMTGKLDIKDLEDYNKFISFMQRNPTLLSSLADPSMLALLKNSSFAAEHPDLFKLLQNETAQSFLSLIGPPPTHDENGQPIDPEKHKQDKMQQLVAGILNACGIGADSFIGQLAATFLPMILGGKAPEIA